MRFKSLLAYGISLAGILAVPLVSNGQDAAAPQNATPPVPIVGKTVPSEQVDMTLGSRSSDVVWEVKVKKGDIVKPGQVLAVLDSREEEAELKTTELLANNDVAVRAAKTTRDQKALELKRMTGVKAGNSPFSPLEVDKAKLDVDLADLDIEKADLEQSKLKMQADTLRTQIERKRLVSRIGGIVREINIEKGGVVDPQKPAIVVVNNSPLWVTVHLPIEMALPLGKTMREEPNKKLEFGVLYPGAKKPIPAKAIFFDPKGDPAGDSQEVTLEIENQEKLPAGIKVEVIPPQLDKVADAKVK